MAGIIMPYMPVSGMQFNLVIPPSEIPNLNIWYNGSASSTTVNGTPTNNFNTSVVNGTAISQWNDLSGTGHVSSATGGASAYPNYAIPVQNGLGSVFYTAANSENLDINPTPWAQNLSGFSIYVVARPTSYAATFPLAVSNANLGIGYDGTYMTVGAATGNAQAQAFGKDTSKFHMFGMIFDGTQTGNANRLRMRIDRQAQALTFTANVGTVTSVANDYFYFGGENRPSISLGFMDGYIGEVLMWTRALNTNEINGIENYLNNKWGLGL